MKFLRNTLCFCFIFMFLETGYAQMHTLLETSYISSEGILEGKMSLDKNTQADILWVYGQDVNTGAIHFAEKVDFQEGVFKEDENQDYFYYFRVPILKNMASSIKISTEVFLHGMRVGVAEDYLENVEGESFPVVIKNKRLSLIEDGHISFSFDTKGVIPPRSMLKSTVYRGDGIEDVIFTHEEVLKNLKTDSSIVFFIPAKEFSGSYLIEVEILDDSKESLTGKYTEPYQQGSPLITLEEVSPSSPTYRQEGGDFVFNAKGFLKTEKSIKAEIQWQQGVGMMKKIKKEIIEENQQFDISLPINLDFSQGDLSLDLSFIDLETNQKILQRNFHWKILMTEGVIVSESEILKKEGGANQEEGKNRVMKRIWFFLGSFLSLIFLFFLGKKVRRKFFAGFIIYAFLLGGNTFAFEESNIGSIFTFPQEGSLQNINGEKVIEGIVSLFWLEEAYGCDQIQLKKGSEVLKSLSCEDVYWFSSSPYGVKRMFSFSLPLDFSEEGVLEVILNKQGKELRVGEVLLSAKQTEEVLCPLGSNNNCHYKANCRLYKTLVGGWRVLNPKSFNQAWTYKEGEREGSCLWGCEDGFSADLENQTCMKSPEWKTGEWSICEGTCGEALQSRNVFCVIEGNTVEESLCTERKPLKFQTCQKEGCCISTGSLLETEPEVNFRFREKIQCENPQIGSCPKAYKKNKSCCSGVSALEATSFNTCDPYQGGSCFFCPDRVQSGSECSGWKERCI